tara:strand:+ start:27231 stop:27689 length:459 start_codon:yes stop_codon:yes gene_type:complete
MKFCTGLLLLTLAGCGGVDSDFSESTSKTIFTTVNSELHTLHLAVMQMPEWPAQFTRQCDNGGAIAMTTTMRSDDSIRDLKHTFEDCVIDGRIIRGNLDYTDVVDTDCGGSSGFLFSIVGELLIAGSDEGQCEIDAVESCGSFGGVTCGYAL